MDPEGIPAHSAEARREYILQLMFFITWTQGLEGTETLLTVNKSLDEREFGFQEALRGTEI
jgi:hypothetical protein